VIDHDTVAGTLRPQCFGGERVRRDDGVQPDDGGKCTIEIERVFGRARLNRGRHSPFAYRGHLGSPVWSARQRRRGTTGFLRRTAFHGTEAALVANLASLAGGAPVPLHDVEIGCKICAQLSVDSKARALRTSGVVSPPSMWLRIGSIKARTSSSALAPCHRRPRSVAARNSSRRASWLLAISIALWKQASARPRSGSARRSASCPDMRCRSASQ